MASIQVCHGKRLPSVWRTRQLTRNSAENGPGQNSAENSSGQNKELNNNVENSSGQLQICTEIAQDKTAAQKIALDKTAQKILRTHDSGENSSGQNNNVVTCSQICYGRNVFENKM